MTLKTYVTRSTFSAVFKDAMKQTKVYFSDGTFEDGHKPHLFMRNQITGSEREFYEGEETLAWAYFEQNCSELRVTDLSGSIYFDTY